MKTRAKFYLEEIYGIFSCAAVLVYSWSMLIFFWDLPSYLLRLSAGDVFGILSYQLVLALIESGIMTALAASFAVIVSIKRVDKHLSVAGSLLIVALACVSLLFKNLAPLITWIAVSLSISVGIASQAAITLMTLVIIGGVIASIILPKHQKARTVIKKFVENLSTLSSLYAILSFFAIFVLIYRNVR